MSHYLYSGRQSRFLQRKAIEKKEMERCCDCPGNDFCPRQSDPCQGFERGCICDDDIETFRKARQ